MPAQCQEHLNGAESARNRLAAVRVAALRRELLGLGADPYVVEATVSRSLSWVADMLFDVAFTLRDPGLGLALSKEAFAVLTLARSGHQPSGRAPVRPRLRSSPPPQPATPLTECEAVVLRRLQGEQSLREIGAELYVSVNTVKSHVRSIYRKFNVTSRREAVSRARGLRLL